MLDHNHVYLFISEFAFENVNGVYGGEILRAPIECTSVLPPDLLLSPLKSSHQRSSLFVSVPSSTK